MTPAEIVKSLRCCAEIGECEKCPIDAEATWDDCRKRDVEAADMIERLTAENAALREKVPEPGKRVLATDGVFVGEAYRTSADTWRRYDGIAMRDCLGSIVTHWMPLPEGGDKHE